MIEASPAHSRRGVTLAEIIVAVVILSVLGAITIPTVMSRLAVGNGKAIATELASLGQGLRGFYTNVGTFPKNLADLTVAPASPVSYCSLAIPAASIAKWRGPYTSRFITGDYTVNHSTIVNAMTYTAGPPAYLQITINNVTSDVARAIEEATDGPVVSNSYSTGAFTFTAPNAVYRIPVRAC